MNWMGFTVRTLWILQFCFRCLKVLFIKLLLKLQLKPPIQGLWKLRWYHTFGQNLSNILGCHYCGFETCWKPQLSCVKGSLKRVWNFQNSFLREGNDQSLNGRALSLLIHCSQSSKREKILVFARDAASIGHLENWDLSSFLWQGKISKKFMKPTSVTSGFELRQPLWQHIPWGSQGEIPMLVLPELTTKCFHFKMSKFIFLIAFRHSCSPIFEYFSRTTGLY